jgi:hypothetical protein
VVGGKGLAMSNEEVNMKLIKIEIPVVIDLEEMKVRLRNAQRAVWNNRCEVILAESALGKPLDTPKTKCE